MSTRNPHEPRNEHQQASFEAGQKAIRELMAGTHGASYHRDMVEGMIAGFVGEHRTIQQETVKFLVQMLIEWGKNPAPRVADARNDATYKFAQHLAGMNLYFPFI